MVSLNSVETTGALITRLRGEIETCFSDLVDEVKNGQRFSLLDFPDHDNIGDSAIYCGELDFFSSLGQRPSYVASKETYAFSADDLEQVTEGGPIFLHGGGNFGDVWPWFQPFRESVLARFRSRRVIQLPQTIHFQSQQKLEETARIIERHGAFTLLVRDTRSYELAKRWFQCDVRLCPDMAFQIASIPSGTAKRRKLLLHFRTDKESARQSDFGSLRDVPGVLEADWPTESANWVTQTDQRNIFRLGYSYLAKGRAAVREARYRGRATARLARGFSLLGSADAVITDRLHGHIMSTLLGVPHCVLDNSYGKTSGFMNTWGTEVAHVHSAGSVTEALEILTEREGLKLGTHDR